MKNNISSLASVTLFVLFYSITGFADINAKLKNNENSKTQLTDALFKSLPKITYNSCVQLTIAPFQLDPDVSGNPLIVHPAENYLRSATNPIAVTVTSFGITLEEGMRIGVDTSACASRGAGPQLHNYTGKIELIGSGINQVLASALKNGETAAIPAMELNNEKALKIKLTAFKRKCNKALGTGCTAGGQIIEQTVDQIQAYIRPTGGYCSASYSKTAFDLEEKGGFRSASVTNVLVNGTPKSSIDNRRFSALGWRLGTNAKPADFGEIVEGDYFVLYPNDFRDEHIAAGKSEAQTTALIGSSARSGLVWPRILGLEPETTQTGRTLIPKDAPKANTISNPRTIRYWYACTLPRITRDVLVFCNDHPHTYYDMMFAQNTESTIGQDPDIDGTDLNAQGNLGSHAYFYAWDIGKSVGTPIFAARGGVVRYAEESYDCNANDPGQTKSTCPGNLIIIEHQDGTIANYLHLQKNSALVSVNDIVKRGQALGNTGNTGNSKGPHLHWGHEFPGEKWIGDPTDGVEPARFRLRKQQANGNYNQLSCYAPITGDVVMKY